jgi:sortase A
MSVSGVVQQSEVHPILSDPSQDRPGSASSPAGAPVRSGGTDPRRLALACIGWLLTAVLGVVIVLYGLSPVFAQRSQHRLLTSYKVALRQSSLEATGLFGLTLPTEPPATGSTDGVLEIGRMHLRDAVVEGVGPAQTEDGPGHVPGTAGLGQPGNAAVVARRSAFGGPFSNVSSMRPGDPIVVTTTEGQTLYVVKQVRTVRLTTGSATPAVTSPLPGASASAGPTAPVRFGSSVAVDDLYGPSTDNRLTLVTSASRLPWSGSRATVVLATMKTLPFTPTPQQSRSSDQDGRSPQGGAWALFVLAGAVFALVALGAVAVYRRCPARSAYLISGAPLLVATVLLATAITRMLPAWA